ncbi:MAG: F0F1 ATP synthase subunit alpha, partial [Clostridiales bacterium]|nr:F0F1 ATP synthase subunit alpha [Clostridiales bacterium]
MAIEQDDFPVLLRYVTPPTDEQLAGIRRFVADKYGRPEQTLSLKLIEDKSLVSGFKLTAGNDEYDWSALGRVNQLKDRIDCVRAPETAGGIIDMLKAGIDAFELEAKSREIGVVRAVGDGIVIVGGIDHAAYGEIVMFDSGLKGMVQDILYDSIGCILFGPDTEIKEGSRVVRTGKSAGAAVSDEILGRAVDALG